MRIALLIPDLLWNTQGDTNTLASTANSPFAKTLARGRPTRGAPIPVEALLLDALGLPMDSALANFRALGDDILTPQSTYGVCLCADPVHLHFHHQRLFLAHGYPSLQPQTQSADQSFVLSNGELAVLEHSLNDAFANRPESFRFFLRGLDGKRGYVCFQGNKLIRPTTPIVPVSTRIGYEISPTDQGEDPAIRNLSNEIQMLLHKHPVNEARTAAGKPTVNALWLWGNGNPPPPGSLLGPALGDAIGSRVRVAPRFERIASHGGGALVAGLAKALKVPLVNVDTPTLMTGRANTLVFSSILTAATASQDAAAYTRAWEKLDRSLLSPLLIALLNRRIKELKIISPGIFGTLTWTLSPGAAWLIAAISAMGGSRTLVKLADQLRNTAE